MRLERLVVTGAALLLSSPLPAQPATARLVLGGGTATDLRGVGSGAWALAPSITLTRGAGLVLSLGGRGTRFTTGEWSLAGSGAAGLRLPLGSGLGLRLAAQGDATRTSYHAAYLSLEGRTALEWRHGGLSLWGGARGAAARTRWELPNPPSPLPLPPSHAGLNRSLLGPAFGGSLELVRFGPGGGIQLSYREERGRPDSVPVIDRVAELGVARGALALSGSLGLRRASDERRAYAAARFGLTLAPGFVLIGAAESYPANRLAGAPGGRALTAGVSLELGRQRPRGQLPRPAGVPRPAPGLTRLSLAAPGASTVEVAGDWNGWRPIALARSRNGVWYLDLAIPEGRYRYGFRVDGRKWEVPEGVAAVDDGFGGKSAWLSVPGPARTATQSANRKEAP